MKETATESSSSTSEDWSMRLRARAIRRENGFGEQTDSISGKNGGEFPEGEQKMPIDVNKKLFSYAP